MRCDEVRRLLPEVADGTAEGAVRGAMERHLASCAACSAELRRYQATIAQLSALREEVIDPPVGALERTLAKVPGWRWRLISRRVVADERLKYAALSAGAVVVGAVAIGLVRRRAIKRAVALAGTAAPLA